MRVAICDDEKTEQQWIKRLVLEWAKEKGEPLEVVCFSSGEAFWFSWEEDAVYDLLILDIEMGTLNGMELAKRIRKEGGDVPILFVTGYDEYMAQGYEVAAIHYLVKPLLKESLFTVLERVKSAQKKQEEKLLFLGEEGMISFLISKIWYIEARGHQCILVTEKKELILRESISAIEERLKEKRGFIRCHRSYLVNLGYVAAVLPNEIVLDSGGRIPLSRRMSKEVYQAFMQNYQ